MATKREVIGWDIEDMAITANNTVTSSKNVLGSNSVITTSGVATTDLDPIKANSAHNFAKFIQLASVLGLETDRVKRKFTSVYDNLLYGETRSAAKPLAYRETADVDVTSFAAGNEALQAAGTLHWNGNREYYTVDRTATSAAITPIEDFDNKDFSKFYFVEGIAARSTYTLFFEYEEGEFNETEE